MEKYFKLKENGTDVRTEVIAGVTTFLSMVYILAVNPNILSAAGMDSAAVFTATAVSAFFGTLFMAFFANYPVALASGMGLNAYFAFSVCIPMAKAGINKRALARYGGEVYCFMSDEDVAKIAKENGTTRATASMDKAATLDKKLIFAIGNAPTALVRLYELIEDGKLNPELIIGVPVGFVNVVQSKELIMDSGAPYIVARGRKGGSNIAACICNALLYMIDNRRD